MDTDHTKIHKQLLDDFMEMIEYWKLDHTLWRTCFGRGYGPVTGQITE